MYFLKMLEYKLAEFPKAWHNKDWRTGFTTLLGLATRFFYASGEFVVYCYSLPNRYQPPALDPGLEIRPVNSAQEFSYLEAITEAVDMARFYEMDAQGSSCFFALHQDRVAGYTWTSIKNNLAANRVQPPLQAGEALIHDIFVAPEFRRQGIAEALLTYQMNVLFSQGFIRALTGVDLDNKASLRLQEKLGAERLTTMTYKRILFWRWLKTNAVQ